MKIITVGINHKTAPIALREQFFLNSTQRDLLLSQLKCDPSIAEAFVLSTCNRIEIYAHVLDETQTFPLILDKICKIKGIPRTPETSKSFYIHTNKDAILHLFHVTTGLDSLVLGEKQILGQVREALDRGREAGMFLKGFNLLANAALRAGKQAQSDTNISFGGSSVGWAAIALAEEHLGTLENKSVLIIGAGKMGEVSLAQIKNKGVSEIYLMNRTEDIALRLAEKYEARACAFADIKEILKEVDAVICAAAAPHYVLESSTVQKILPIRDARPLVLLDISMPRNIDPSVAQFDKVKLSHLDDLEHVVAKTMKTREAAIGEVELIIQNRLNHFYHRLSKVTNNHTSTIPI